MRRHSREHWTALLYSRVFLLIRILQMRVLWYRLSTSILPANSLMAQNNRRWRRCAIYACVVLAVFPGLPVVAQKKVETAKRWSTRARALTDSIVVDTVAFENFDRALLFGRLGEAWWKDDRARARTWLKKAVEDLDYATSPDANARRHKLSAARALLAIVAPRDRELSARLANVFVTDSEKTPDDEREQNAEALLDAALAVVDSDPGRAASLGAASLRNRPSPQLVDLLVRLSARDSRLGAALFSQALNLASASSDGSLFLQLGQMAFPNGQSPPSNPIPVEARTQLLATLANRFLSHQSETGKPGDCKLAWIVAPLVGQYDRLLPQQTFRLREMLVRCQTNLDSVARERVNESTNKPLKSVDDFLQAAEKAADPRVRGFHLARAAFAAAQQRDYDRAIAILESIGTEERKLMNGGWERGRSDWAARSALAYAKSGDYATMRKVIADTPSDLRPLTLMDVAENLAEAGDQIVATELAHEARGALQDGPLSKLQQVHTYISLVRLFATLAPAEAPVALQEMVAAINRTTQSEEVNTDSFGARQGDVAPLAPISLPASLLEVDSIGVQHTVSSIQRPIHRVRVRLGLLHGSLEKMRSAATVKKQAVVAEESRRNVER